MMAGKQSKLQLCQGCSTGDSHVMMVVTQSAHVRAGEGTRPPQSPKVMMMMMAGGGSLALD